MNGKFPIMTAALPATPKIKLCLSGLGVLCLSPENNRAEIGYLDVEEHDALVSMKNSKGDYLIPLNTSLRGRRLEVITPRKGMGECYSKEGESRNFDSMLDLSEIYGEAADFKENARFQSKIFIDNAVFFTEPQSIISVEPYDESSPAQRLPPKNVGTGLWAYSKDRDAAIVFDGKEIPLNESETYEIRILSDCPGDGESDFKYFYDILRDAGTIRYNLDEPETGSAWFTDFELREFETMTKQLNEFFAMKMKMASGEAGLQGDLKSKLKYLTDILCVPKPCLIVTFTNRARNLP